MDKCHTTPCDKDTKKINNGNNKVMFFELSSYLFNLLEY